MRRYASMMMAVIAGAAGAAAQGMPHDFRQDTPPPPGQIVVPPRESLRLAPIPFATPQADKVGLPVSGPMAKQPAHGPRPGWRDRTWDNSSLGTSTQRYSSADD